MTIKLTSICVNDPIEAFKFYTEVLGFVTGGICVWLTVREHMATWPVGLANNVVFFILFWHGRLFG